MYGREGTSVDYTFPDILDRICEEFQISMLSAIQKLDYTEHTLSSEMMLIILQELCLQSELKR